MDASSEFQESLPVHPEALIAYIDQLGMSYSSYTHPPLRTVADSKTAREGLLSAKEGGGHIKNLYLRDRKKQNFLAVIQEDKQVDLKALAEALSAQRLSFGSEDRLFEYLGVRPGAVTPLAMRHGADKDVTIGIDKDLMMCQEIYMHPLVNDRTIGMAPQDLMRFLSSVSVTPLLINIP